MTEQKPDDLKRLAHYHLALAFELCAHAYIIGAAHMPDVKQCIDRIEMAGNEFEAYNQTGKTPSWFDAAPPKPEITLEQQPEQAQS